jgi:hypothetical protein
MHTASKAFSLGALLIRVGWKMTSAPFTARTRAASGKYMS